MVLSRKVQRTVRNTVQHRNQDDSQPRHLVAQVVLDPVVALLDQFRVHLLAVRHQRGNPLLNLTDLLAFQVQVQRNKNVKLDFTQIVVIRRDFLENLVH